MFSFVSSLIPKMHRIRLEINTRELSNPEQHLYDKAMPILSDIKPGARIGIAAGSRGIWNYASYIKTVVKAVSKCGGVPIIIPAMGSHGGGTAEGQIEILAGYGITPDSMGCDIRSSMDVIELGNTKSGAPVFFDRNASEMDGIILVNRVKPHTDFHSKIESGVVKQMVIGLGKHKGASVMHRRGVFGLANVISEAAEVILSKMPILMGVAILENAYDRTADIEVMRACDFMQREPELLDMARTLMPSFPVDELDVLILQQMGKSVSGSGIDTNVVGRYRILDVPDEPTPHIYRIVCLDITEESHGNASGVGIMDVINKRLADKINWESTYMNAVTSGFLERGFLPIVTQSDKAAIETALYCCNRPATVDDARVILAKNTLELSELIVSDAVYEDLKNREDIEYLGTYKFSFDQDDNIKNLL